MNLVYLGQQFFFSLLQTNYIAIYSTTNFFDLFYLIFFLELFQRDVKITLKSTLLNISWTQYFFHCLSKWQIIFFLLLGISFRVKLFPSNFIETTNQIFIILKNFILIFGFDVNSSEINSLFMKIMQSLKENISSRQFFTWG